MIEAIKPFILPLIGSYFILVLFIYFMQDRLIFAGAYSYKKSIQENKNMVKGINEFNFTTKDNINLNGAISKNNSDTLLIFFSGNAQNTISFVSLISSFNDVDIVGLNYRGYDESEGIPTEQKLYADALEIYDHFKDKYKYIIPVGNSLGSCVATYVGSKRKVQGLILTVPLDSVLDVAKNIYQVFPIKLLLKYPFDSVANLKNIDSPISILMVKDDKIIPNKNTINLKENVKNLSLFTVVEDSGHNKILEDDRLLKFMRQSINDFK